MRKILALTFVSLSLSLAACSNAPVDDAKANTTAETAEAPKPHYLGEFKSAEAISDAALTHCTQNGFKGDYVATQTFTPEGKRPYNGTVMLDNPCIKPATAT